MSMDSNNDSGSVFWPILLLAISINLFLVLQLLGQWQRTSGMLQQQAAMSGQLEQLRANVVPAQKLQLMLQGLANDMLNEASHDPDVRKVVEKYQIRRAQTVPR